MQAKVLVVEDEPALAELAALYLAREGIETRLCLSAEDARRLVAEDRYDLIILDVNLPGMDGFEFLQEFRRTSDTPVLIVSARESDEDIITGLSVGADEFVSKPVAPRVLAARVRALLRRSRAEPAGGDQRRVARFGDFSLDFDACLLYRGSERLPLSAREFDVLAFLVANAGKTLAPQELYEQVWGQRYGDPTTVGVYVQRIRKKIEDKPQEPRLLQTVKGKGYRFDPDSLGGGT